MRTEFPVTDEAITALRIKVLRALSAAPYPREALPYIAIEQHITVDDARALVEKHGWPERGPMGRAADVLEGKREPDPPAPKPGPKPKPPIISQVVSEMPPKRQPAQLASKPPADGAEQLLKAAAKSSRARTRRLAVKVRDELKEIADLLRAEADDAEAEKAAAEARAAEELRIRDEIAGLQAQIAERRKLLRKTKPKAYEAVSQPNVKPAEPRRVRAWAVENGVECPQFGPVPVDVLMAYQRAQTSEGEA